MYVGPTQLSVSSFPPQCCKFHPNGNYIGTGSCDKSVRLWDILNGQCVRIFTGHKVSCVGLSSVNTLKLDHFTIQDFSRFCNFCVIYKNFLRKDFCEMQQYFVLLICRKLHYWHSKFKIFQENQFFCHANLSNFTVFQFKYVYNYFRLGVESNYTLSMASIGRVVRGGVYQK